MSLLFEGSPVNSHFFGIFEYSLEWSELTSIPLQGNFLKDSLHFLLLLARAGYKDTTKKNETKQKNA